MGEGEGGGEKRVSWEEEGGVEEVEGRRRRKEAREGGKRQREIAEEGMKNKSASKDDRARGS